MTQEAIMLRPLQLIRGGADAQERTPPRAYLSSLRTDSARRSTRVCLLRAARIMGAESAAAVEWRALRYSHVEALVSAMQRMGRYQPATINATLAALKGVARQAWLLGPADGLEMTSDDYRRIAAVRRVPATRDRRGRALSDEELAALLQACERDPTAAGARDACLLALMARGGLRREECVAAALSDFDRRGHALLVHGKGDRERVVYFGPGGARRALHAWLRARGGGAGALLCPVDKTGRVCVRRMSAQAVYKALKKRARQAALRRPVAPHDLRRTYASDLLDAGADLSRVQKLLGHVDVSTTTIYDRRDERGKRAAAALLELPYRAPRRGRAPPAK
jgi:site-specific recombinase XerD